MKFNEFIAQGNQIEENLSKSMIFFEIYRNRSKSMKFIAQGNQINENRSKSMRFIEIDQNLSKSMKFIAQGNQIYEHRSKSIHRNRSKSIESMKFIAQGCFLCRISEILISEASSHLKKSIKIDEIHCTGWRPMPESLRL